MDVVIRKAEVYKEVEKLTAVIGASVVSENGDSAYSAVWANEYDAGVLDTWWRDGTGAVLSMLMRYVGSGTVEHRLYGEELGEVFEVKVVMPDRFDDHLVGSIQEEMKRLLACLVTAGWLGVKLPDRRKEMDERAAAIGVEIRAKLSYRKPPVRKVFEEERSEIEFKQNYGKGDDCAS